MKVKIGPHRSWVGPYQIAEFLCFWVREVPDELGIMHKPDWVHDFGTWLAQDRNGNDTWLTRFCNWIQERKKRRIKIHIDPYDVWSMDHTLALIILPMLKQLRDQKHGYGWIDNKDVPRDYRSTVPGARKGLNKWDWDHNAEARYAWVMEELIWTFTQLCDDSDGEAQFFDHSESSKEKDFNLSMKKLRVDRAGLKAHQDRIDNGLRLFGKYFRTLWD